MSGVSERITKTCEKFDLKVVFKSGPTFRSLLTSVKDPLPMEKLAEWSIRLGEMQRRLETRVKEYKDACEKGKSAIAEHAQDQQHTIDWPCVHELSVYIIIIIIIIKASVFLTPRFTITLRMHRSQSCPQTIQVSFYSYCN